MTQKIAVSLPDEQVSYIRRAVAQGRAASVSGYISAAVARTEREDGLTELLDDLDRELGQVDDADLAWADRALGLA
ncbi:MAG: toxin-antitoxin system antitoxin subunit [Actinomyces succiniciruminis]|nr:toxin-antitoxin system antitoxin subunit [Actinomyces succiniciruminis]